jgi:predicted RNA binding protein YcfA (HicA-like mRNA interferase family)
MKRPDLIRYLEKQGCEMLLESSDHAVYVNRAAMKVSTVPLHREIDEFLSAKICRDLRLREPA